MSERSRRAWAFLPAAAITGVFFINLCGTIFQCGCRSLWAGAAQHCNIHDPATRNCPWCEIGTAGGATIVGTILAAQAAVAFRPAGWFWLTRFLLATAAFPVVGTILGFATGFFYKYWE